MVRCSYKPVTLLSRCLRVVLPPRLQADALEILVEPAQARVDVAVRPAARRHDRVVWLRLRPGSSSLSTLGCLRCLRLDVHSVRDRARRVPELSRDDLARRTTSPRDRSVGAAQVTRRAYDRAISVPHAGADRAYSRRGRARGTALQERCHLAEHSVGLT